MSFITTEPIVFDDGEGIRVLVDGLSMVGFTPETEIANVMKFVELCKKQEDELVQMMHEYEGCIALNMKRQEEGKEGKNWPVFDKRDQIVSRLCKEAGITDT